MDPVRPSESPMFLPPSKLPVFRGEIKEWASFREVFNKLIYSNDQIPAGLKLVYLKACVRGEALAIFDNTDASYDDAWELLALRYDAAGEIVSKYVQNLLQMEKVSDGSPEGLGKLLTDFECNVHVLRLLREPTDQWSTLLVHLLCDKLDSTTLQEWKNHIKSPKVPTISQLVQFIKARCEAMQTSKKPATSLTDSTISQDPSTVFNCSVCQTTYHLLSKCCKYLDTVMSARCLPEDRDASKSTSDNYSSSAQNTSFVAISPGIELDHGSDFGNSSVKKHEVLCPEEGKELYQRMFQNGRLKLAGEGFCLPLILTPFFHLEGFFQAYENYLRDPDEGIVVAEKVDRIGSSLLFKKLCDQNRLQTYATPSEHCLIMDFHKNQYYLNFDSLLCILITGLFNSMDSITSACKYSNDGSGCVHISSRNLADRALLKDLHANMKFYPKLRAKIYKDVIFSPSFSNLVYESPLRHVQPVLRSLRFTVFHIIAYFVLRFDNTKARSNPDIMIEVERWFAAYQSLAKTWGKDLQFLKHLAPAVPPATLWPNLAQLAYIHGCSQSSVLRRRIDPRLANELAVSTGDKIMLTFQLSKQDICSNFGFSLNEYPFSNRYDIDEEIKQLLDNIDSGNTR